MNAGTTVTSAGADADDAGQQARRRQVSVALDLLRGLAAMAMVVNHVGARLVPASAHNDSVTALLFFVSSAAPVLFFFVTGFAAALRRPPAKWTSRLPTIACLIVADLFFAWHVRRPWVFDFFGFIALSTLIVDVLAVRRHAVALAWGGVAASLLLRFAGAPLAVDASPPWAWVLGFPAVHGVSYPLTPWLCYPLLGFALGRWSHARAASAPPRRVLAALATVFVCGLAGTAICIAGDHPLNRWSTMTAGYFAASLAILSGAIGIALAIPALLPARAGPALSLRGVAAYAVVPLHFGLIALLRATGVVVWSPLGYVALAVPLVVAALFLARRFAAELGGHSGRPWLRPLSASVVGASAAALWWLPQARQPLAGESLVVLAQLAIAAWMLPPRPAAATAGTTAPVGLPRAPR